MMVFFFLRFLGFKKLHDLIFEHIKITLFIVSNTVSVDVDARKFLGHELTCIIQRNQTPIYAKDPIFNMKPLIKN